MSTLVTCKLCGESCHSVQLHLSKSHPGVSLGKYQEQFPGAPIFSEAALARLAEKTAAEAVQPPVAQVVTLHHAATNLAYVAPAAPRTTKRALYETFDLAQSDKTVNLRGGEIQVTVHQGNPHVAYIPDVDPDHVWDVEDLKTELMAIEMGWPLLVFGHKGTGKTSDIDQIAARCRRPVVRVQHTANLEEAHVVGQWTVADGNTVFQLGFLAQAMLDGMIYLADEYDIAQPGVCTAYQSVMEGKPLVIKDAPPHLRIIKPAPGFTFVATGNTNGTGDPTGLYPGTTVQNSANYDRFVIKLRKDYMAANLEADAVVRQTKIARVEAEKLVKIAGEIRKMYSAGKLSDTISTRAMVNIARVGIMRARMRLGFQLCYANGLNEVDYKAVDGVAQRVYG